MLVKHTAIYQHGKAAAITYHNTLFEMRHHHHHHLLLSSLSGRCGLGRLDRPQFLVNNAGVIKYLQGKKFVTNASDLLTTHRDIDIE